MKIIVVVDMQNDFIFPSFALGTPEAEQVHKAISHYLNYELDRDTYVVFTKDTHGADYLYTPEGKHLSVPHCIKGTNGWEIPEDLTKPFLNSPVVIEKPTFGSIELMNWLQDIITIQDTTEIEFCGLCTDICVISNVLLAKAFFPNATITVNSRLCAGVTPQTHEAALTVMRSCQVIVKG